MRKANRLPRIIRIIKVRGFEIHCAYNNGEYRIIDFNKLFKKWKLKKSSFAFPLKNPKEFKKVELRSGTLAWPSVTKVIKLPNGETFETYLDLDPLVLYENSRTDEKMNKRYQIGSILKKERLKAGLTQQQLAIRSGTTKNYISRIENNKSDIELRTLRKIIEIGLSKNLEIAIN